MKKRLLVGLGVLVVVFGVYKVSRRHAPVDFLELDRKTLNDPKATDAQLFGALIRLSHRGDQAARTRALESRGSVSPVVREACAAALGYFSDHDAMTALTEMLRDKETKVRMRAIEALSYFPSKERQDALDTVLKDTSLTFGEQDAAYSSLLRMSPTPERRAVASKGLLTIAKGGGKIADLDANMAVSHMISLAPSEPGLMDLLKEIVKSGKRLQVIPMSIRYLAAKRDPWMRANMASLAKSPTMQIRMTSVQVLHLACPHDRWAILKDVLNNEKDIGVLHAGLQALSNNAGPEALQLAEDVQSHKKYERNEMLALSNSIAIIKKGTSKDPCSNVPSEEMKKAGAGKK